MYIVGHDDITERHGTATDCTYSTPHVFYDKLITRCDPERQQWAVRKLQDRILTDWTMIDAFCLLHAENVGLKATEQTRLLACMSRHQYIVYFDGNFYD